MCALLCFLGPMVNLFQYRSPWLNSFWKWKTIDHRLSLVSFFFFVYKRRCIREISAKSMVYGVCILWTRCLGSSVWSRACRKEKLVDFRMRFRSLTDTFFFSIKRWKIIQQWKIKSNESFELCYKRTWCTIKSFEKYESREVEKLSEKFSQQVISLDHAIVVQVSAEKCYSRVYGLEKYGNFDIEKQLLFLSRFNRKRHEKCCRSSARSWEKTLLNAIRNRQLCTIALVKYYELSLER